MHGWLAVAAYCFSFFHFIMQTYPPRCVVSIFIEIVYFVIHPILPKYFTHSKIECVFIYLFNGTFWMCQNHTKHINFFPNCKPCDEMRKCVIASFHFGTNVENPVITTNEKMERKRGGNESFTQKVRGVERTKMHTTWIVCGKK